MSTGTKIYFTAYYIRSVSREKTEGHKFAKWAKVGSFAEALCWMVLKGGGKGVRGRTFNIVDSLASVADSSTEDDDVLALDRDMQNIALEDREQHSSPRNTSNPVAAFPQANGMTDTPALATTHEASTNELRNVREMDAEGRPMSLFGPDGPWRQHSNGETGSNTPGA